jgi:hypothetical protein
LLATENYFRIHENRTVKASGKIRVLQSPRHGTLEGDEHGNYLYLPAPGYLGKDRATLLAEMGGVKIKMVYFFQVLDGVADSDYPERCPKEEWRISHANDVPRR